MAEENEKPSWDYSPDWAKYLAMDADGMWYWYENAPTKTDDAWVADGRCARALNTAWEYTLEQRPNQET